MFSKSKNLQKNKLKIIEDFAQAFNKNKNKKLGTFGDVGGFSFYGNKLITTGLRWCNCYKFKKNCRRSY